MVFQPAGFPEIRLGSWQPPQTDESLCCGYDELEMILVSTGGVMTEVQAFEYGGWTHVDVLGDRIWALEQSNVVEAGYGPMQIAYSPDRGKSWFQLAEIPDPSEDIMGQPAAIRAFTMEKSGQGTLVLQLAEDDEAYADCMESFFARVQHTFGGHPCPGAAKGDYEYRTEDFGRTWVLRSRP